MLTLKGNSSKEDDVDSDRCWYRFTAMALQWASPWINAEKIEKGGKWPMVWCWGPPVHSGWLKRAVQTSPLAAKHKVESVQTACTINPTVFVCTLDPGTPCQMHSVSGKINNVKVVQCESVKQLLCTEMQAITMLMFEQVAYALSRSVAMAVVYTHTHTSMWVTNTTKRQQQHHKDIQLFSCQIESDFLFKKAIWNLGPVFRMKCVCVRWLWNSICHSGLPVQDKWIFTTSYNPFLLLPAAVEQLELILKYLTVTEKYASYLQTNPRSTEESFLFDQEGCRPAEGNWRDFQWDVSTGAAAWNV